MNIIIEKLLIHPIVPVFYHADVMYAQSVLQACYDGGLRVFEFTNRGANAAAVFSNLKTYAQTNCPDLTLGIGTIYNSVEAEDFIKLGADFVVQPVTTAAVGEICKQQHIPWIPGVLTATEIYQATLLGAEMVKIFPGNALGSNYIKALRGPMPEVKIMVTGGVEPTEASLQEWFDAGVNCVGIGSQLLKNSSNLTQLTDQVSKLTAFVNNLIKIKN